MQVFVQNLVQNAGSCAKLVLKEKPVMWELRSKVTEIPLFLTLLTRLVNESTIQWTYAVEDSAMHIAINILPECTEFKFINP